MGFYFNRLFSHHNEQIKLYKQIQVQAIFFIKNKTNFRAAKMGIDFRDADKLYFSRITNFF